MKPFFSIKTIASLILLFFLILIFSIILITNSLNQKQTYKSKAEEMPIISPTPEEASPSAILNQEIEAKNQEVLQTLDKYNSQPQDEQIKQELINKVKERNKKIIEGLDISPYVIYQKAFDNNILSKFPEETKPCLEQRLDKTITGLVNTYIADDFENNKSYTYSTIIDEQTNQEYNFYPTSEQTSFITYLSSTKVSLNNGLIIKNSEEEQVKGKTADDNTQLSNNKGSVVSVDMQIHEQTPPDAKGLQQVLVFFVKHSSVKISDLPNKSDIEVNFSKASAFYDTASYNRLSLNFTFLPRWYEVDLLPSDDWLADIRDAYGQIKGRWDTKLILRGVLKQALKENEISIDSLNNFKHMVVIYATGLEKKPPAHGSYGRNYFFKINDSNQKEFLDSNIQSSFAILPLSAHWLDYINPIYLENIDGFQISPFGKVLIHELGHGLGLRHASSLYCFRDSISFPFKYIDNSDLISLSTGGKCYLTLYGNVYDVMGKGSLGLDINAYFKKTAGWIDIIDSRIFIIDIKKPDGNYTLKLITENEGKIAAWLPFATSNKNNTLRDYFFEYRKDSKMNLLMLNIPSYSTLDSLDNIIHDSFLFTNKKYKYYFGLSLEETFTDTTNNIQVKPIEVNLKEKTLTFTIISCNTDRIKDNPFYIQSYHAGDGKTSSINVFESDIDKEIKKGNSRYYYSGRFSIENKSNCFFNNYNLDKNITINTGQTKLTMPIFSGNNIEDNLEIKPLTSEYNSFKTTVTPFNPNTQQDSSITFNVRQKMQGNDDIFTKSITFYFHLIPTPNEYKTDFEPQFIKLINNDDNEQLNSLNIKREQKILFKSAVSNNSKDTKVGVKTPDFKVQWSIKKLSQENPLVEEQYNHQGLSSMMSSFESKASTFLYQMPADLPAGDYKVVYEVLKSEQIDEFNQNNNVVFREFTIVE